MVGFGGTYDPSTRSFNTRCFVTVYRHNGAPIQFVGDTTQTLGQRQGGPASLVSASYSKNMQAPSGPWTVGLKQGSLDIRKEIKAGDWIVMHWTRNGKPLHGVLGVIRNVTRSRRSNRGNTVEDWTLSGVDFGHVFERSTIWFDDYTNFETNAGGAIMSQRFGWNPIGSPDAIVLNIANAWLGFDSKSQVGGTWKWPQGLEYLGDNFAQGLHAVVGDADAMPLSEILERATVPQLVDPLGVFQRKSLRGLIGSEVNLFQPNIGGRLHDLMLEYSNTLLNELYYDLTPLKRNKPSSPEKPLPCLFLREHPFVNASEGLDSPWFSLPTVKISRDSVLQSTVMSNDDERVNCVLIYPAGIGVTSFDSVLINGPAYDRESARQHGIRKLERQTRFILPPKEKSWSQEIEEWANLLISWHGLNHEWLSGSLSVPYILPEVRVGTRIQVGEDDANDKEQFYAEGVDIKWQYPTGGTTSFTVTHGHEGSDHDLVKNVVTTANKFLVSGARLKPGNVDTTLTNGLGLNVNETNTGVV
jgi:hypothetical protein